MRGDLLRRGFSRPRTHRAFPGGFFERLGRGIAQREKNGPRPVRFSALEQGQRLPQGGEPEVGLPFRTINTVQKSRHLEEFAAGIHEIQIQELLARHGRNK